MSSDMTVNPIGGLDHFGDLSKRWGWLLALGIVFIGLGLIGIGMAFALTIASLIVFGALLLIGGAVQIVQAFQSKGWKSVLWHVVIAILYVIAGVSVLRDPLLASLILTLIVAGMILAIGIVRVIMAIQMRGNKGWGWVLLGGIVSIALGVLIYLQWPFSALWLIGLFVAIDLIANGWSYVFIALAARDAGKAKATGI
jgi:uncharacterized membrane protein HdeD (DUF308 family)